MQKKIGILILIIFLGFGAEWGARHLFYTETRIREKIEQYEKSYAADTVNLALGVCPMAYGLNPVLFKDKTYNLAYIDQTLYYSAAYLKRAISLSPRLKNVILEVDPLIFFTDEIIRFGDESELGHQKMYRQDNKRFLSISSPGDNWTGVLDRSQFFVFREAFFQKAASCVFRRHCAREAIDPMNNDGFMPMQASFTSNRQYINSAQLLKLQGEVDEYLTKTLHSRNADNNERLLREIVRMAGEKEIQVYLVWPPYYSGFAKALNRSMQIEWKNRFERLIDELVSEKGVHYIDLSQLFAGRTDENDLFFDVIHLNTRGAELFSSVLNTALTEEP